MKNENIIYAKCGIEILVSTEDYESLNKRKWFISRDGYALCNNSLKKMHRLILNANDGDIVDHINRDKLNNTRGNLRIVNRCENTHNQKKRTETKNKYKGTNFVKRLGLYQSRCRIYGKDICLGYFNNEIAAAYAYNKKAIELTDKCDLNRFDLSVIELENLLLSSICKIQSAEFKSKEKNVTWHKSSKKWQVSIRKNGQCFYIGKFKTELEAIKAKNNFILNY